MNSTDEDLNACIQLMWISTVDEFGKFVSYL
jgi:hypothetical protein